MAFDAGFLSFIVNEINKKIAGGRVEKIYQPAKDEFVFIVRGKEGSERLLINAGSRCPRVSITNVKSENPAKAPMMCMLFRKHLQGSFFIGCEQIGFERAAKLLFDTVDEMGYKRKFQIIVEMMGKYSNIIFAYEDGKIINLLRQLDFSDASKRQLLPGMIYEIPPKQDKYNPCEITREQFNSMCSEDTSRLCEKFIMSNFSGIAPLVAREIATLSGGNPSASLCECERKLTDTFFSVIEKIKNSDGTPYAVFDEKGVAKEYSFLPLTQYDGIYSPKKYNSFGEMLDEFFSEKSREEKISQKAADLLKTVANVKSRIVKKTALQKKELEDCRLGEKYKLYGDLITANIYRLKRGQEGVVLTDYCTGEDIKIALDSKLTPAANAQKYYKKYAKSKSAKEHLQNQIDLSEKELLYINSVSEALRHAESENDLSEIRSELYYSGYTSKLNKNTEKKKKTPSYLTFKTTNGYTVLCGKNNLANEYLTFKHSSKSDWWFHAKGVAGSHVIMQCDINEEPDAVDFTDAAVIAAVYSKNSDSPLVDVDYTRVKSVKKPPDSKPGFVIYHTNWSATVKPDAKYIETLIQ